MNDLNAATENKKACESQAKERGLKVSQTFFDLVVHWKRVIRLHVGCNQDLSGILQHLKNKKTSSTQQFT